MQLTEKHGGFNHEHHIRDAETGAIALLLCVLRQSVDDVRLCLSPPEAQRADQPRVSTRKSKIQHRHRIATRATIAREAAVFLDGPDARQVRHVLSACGVHVPMKHIWLELKNLKAPTSCPS